MGCGLGGGEEHIPRQGSPLPASLRPRAALARQAACSGGSRPPPLALLAHLSLSISRLSGGESVFHTSLEERSRSSCTCGSGGHGWWLRASRGDRQQSIPSSGSPTSMSLAWSALSVLACCVTRSVRRRHSARSSSDTIASRRGYMLPLMDRRQQLRCTGYQSIAGAECRSTRALGERLGGLRLQGAGLP